MLLKKTIGRLLLIVILIASCKSQESCKVPNDLNTLLGHQPDWYRCLILDLAELYNGSFESPAPGGITSTNPMELFVIDSNSLDLRMDYRKQREIMRKYPDSLLLKVWELNVSSSLKGADSLKATLDINPHGMFVEHLADLMTNDTIIQDIHEYIVHMGTGRVPIRRALESNALDFNKLSHRYAVMMLLVVYNDDLNRKPGDLEGPKYKVPARSFDSVKVKRLQENQPVLVNVLDAPRTYTVHEVYEESLHPSSESYSFPMLEGPDTAVTRRINACLAKRELNMQLGEEKTSLFENVSGQLEAYLPSLSYLSYEVLMLNERLYSVMLSGEFCSAYCEYYETSYTFDLSTGALLPLDTLFNEDGQKDLLQELIAYKQSTINNKVAEVERLLVSKTLSPDDIEYYEEMLSLYTDCNSEYTDLKRLKYIPSDTGIKIVYGRCSAHYNRAMDELWYFEKELKLEDWKDKLSEIGLQKWELN